MKLHTALFEFDGGAARFLFLDQELPVPVVHVFVKGRSKRVVKNPHREYKPCVTHCGQILNEAENEQLRKLRGAKPRAIKFPRLAK